MSDDREHQDEFDRKITPAHLEHLALFPLPGAVFYPDTMMPLHIFEPRYRALTAEAIADGVPIAVVKLLEPRRANAQGKPAFHDVCGAGFVLHHQELPDGRFNILLEGTARVRILEELESGRPYRVGRAEIIEDALGPPGAVNALVTTLRGCVIGLQHDYARLAEALAKTMNNVHHPGALANTIASIIVADAEQRQQLLEQPRIDARLDALITRLTDLLAATRRFDPDEDGWLN